MHQPLRAAALAVTLAATFAGGIVAGRAMQPAAAQSAPWKPMIINIPAMTAADIGPPPAGSTNAVKMLAIADGGTLQVQMGTVPKHFHSDANEIQYIVEGSGKFWLGDSYHDVKPGDLIIIPKGTPHAGTTTTFKALAIKTPPQDAKDVHNIP